jgi:hypothetical protein
MKTYTIYEDGKYRIGLSAEDAAHELLTYDGYEYQIRPAEDGEGWELWISSASRNSTAWKGINGKSVIFNLEDDEAKARQEIFERVIWTGMWNNEYVTCYPDDVAHEMRRESVTEEVLAEAEIDDDGPNAEDRRKHVDEVVCGAYHHEFTDAEWINEAIKLLLATSPKRKQQAGLK